MQEMEIYARKRAALLRLTLERKFSIKLQMKLGEIVHTASEEFGSPVAEQKATELMDIINECETESEVFKRIKHFK